MPEGLFFASVLLVVLVALPAVFGFVFDQLRAGHPRREPLLSTDNARARATLAYYNEVHDSHSG